MYGIFMESWVIFKLYGGNALHLIVYAAALIFLLIREKNRGARLLFVWLPLLVLAVFFCPLFRKVYVRVMSDGETQYRVLWMVPMGMTVSLAVCRLVTVVAMRGKNLKLKIALNRLVIPAAAALLIVLSGSLVYSNPYVSRAENLYHIPQEAIEVTDLIAPEKSNGRRVRAAVPSDLVHFIRQYNTDVVLAFGRDIIAHGYANDIYEEMELPETINMKKLAEALKEAEVDYLVLKKDRKADASPESEGWKLCGETETYSIFACP